MDKLIVISTGGTGGHVFPALAMAEDLKAEDYKVIIIVDERGRKYLPANDDSIIMIPTYAISGNILQKIFKLFLLAKAILSTIYILLKNRPVLVIGFGGYASFPCCVSAILLSIPFALHEQNAILGKANFVLARFTNLIAISFENTKDILEKYKYKTKFVGNLVRKKIREISPRDNFDKNIFNILVIGGSQGASVFSNIVPEAFAALDIKNKNKINLSFQANIKDVERTKEALLKNNIKSEVKSFFDDIELKLQEADLVIARSGASTIAELEYLEKKHLNHNPSS